MNSISTLFDDYQSRLPIIFRHNHDDSAISRLISVSVILRDEYEWLLSISKMTSYSKFLIQSKTRSKNSMISRAKYSFLDTEVSSGLFFPLLLEVKLFFGRGCRNTIYAKYRMNVLYSYLPSMQNTLNLLYRNRRYVWYLCSCSRDQVSKDFKDNFFLFEYLTLSYLKHR